MKAISRTMTRATISADVYNRTAKMVETITATVIDSKDYKADITASLDSDHILLDINEVLEESIKVSVPLDKFIEVGTITVL